jgi:hypothetical protein
MYEPMSSSDMITWSYSPLRMNADGVLSRYRKIPQLRNFLLTIPEEMEFSIFFRRESSFIEDRKEIPVMVECCIGCEGKKLVECHFEEFDLLSGIRLNRLSREAISSNVVMCVGHYIPCSIVPKPRSQIR